MRLICLALLSTITLAACGNFSSVAVHEDWRLTGGGHEQVPCGLDLCEQHFAFSHDSPMVTSTLTRLSDGVVTTCRVRPHVYLLGGRRLLLSWVRLRSSQR
jgi:hypothetical protein